MVGIPTFLCLALIWLPTLASVVPVVHELARHQRAHREQLRRPQELRDAVHRLPVLLAGRQAQRPLAARPRVHRDADRDLLRGPARPRDARHAHLPERLLHPGRAVARRRRLHLGARCTPPRVHQQPPRHGRLEHLIDFLGNPNLNLWAVLVAASWRHVGYIMVLYLAGPQERRPDPSRGGRDRRRERSARRSSGSSSR